MGGVLKCVPSDVKRRMVVPSLTLILINVGIDHEQLQIAMPNPVTLVPVRRAQGMACVQAMGFAHVKLDLRVCAVGHP